MVGLDARTERIIGAAIAVHNALGPGLLESVYELALAEELTYRQIPFERQKPVPIRYKGIVLDAGLRLDFVIDREVVVELKSVERVLDVHQAQMLTYLKLTGCPIGLLINFNVPVLTRGIRRFINSAKE
jgi:GxxExxY protein